MKRIGLQFKAEIRRTLFSDSVNIFYFFSMIIWPIVSFVQVAYNIQVFPLKTIKIAGIATEKELFYFIFIGYFAYILFQNVVQSCWRLGSERNQGTLSQIFMSPVNKLMWLYSRSFSMLCSNTWFFLILFFVGNLWFIEFGVGNVVKICLSVVFLVFGTWVWGAFISTFFIILRDGTVVFILLEGPQDTFSGVQVPLSISPKVVQIIGSIFPLSYTIGLLREMLITNRILSYNLLWFVLINLFLILSTNLILIRGERHMRQVGNFDLY
jgi:ABC-2 type transport system permease protein